MNRAILAPLAALMIAAPVVAAPARDARFASFFAAFRKAVLSGDRQAVVRMTHFPFTDYRDGRFCEPGDSGCTVTSDTLTSRNAATFLRNYDRIFTPEVVGAIRAGKVSGFVRRRDDGDVAGPIGEGEYLLDTADPDAQRVFVRPGETWTLERIPFRS